MTLKKFAGRVAVAASILCATSAFAAGPTNAEFYPFAEINAKKMGARGDMLTVQQFQELLAYMKAGG
jgi:hypothetical protein